MLGYVTGTEATTAFTDLIIAVFSLILGICLVRVKSAKTEERRLWLFFFFAFAAACATGFVFHYYIWNGLLWRVIWLVMCTLMFAVAVCFHMVCIDMCTDNRRPDRKDRKIIYAVSAVFWIPVALIRFITAVNTTKLFTIYALVFLAASYILQIRSAVTRKPGSVLFLMSLLPVIPGAALQLNRSFVFRFIWDFDFNGITHLLFLFFLLFLYLSALRSLTAVRKLTI